jgi:sterol desaturase/sphingolipid hydroxylase (fatty acid hydroxylase superfamily)
MNASTTDVPGRSAAAETNRGALSLGRTLLAFFEHQSPRLLALQLLVAVALRPWLGPFGATDAMIVAAVVLYWPVQEWVLHKLVLHARPRQLGRVRIDTAAARAHRKHHRNPRDLAYTVLPGGSMLVMIPLHVAFWWGVTRTWGAALTGICALGAAALVYEWIHFLCHAPYRARSAYVRRVRAHHALHHFKNERYWHSFTVPALDRLFGTGPKPSEVPLSATCRDLGVRDD